MDPQELLALMGYNDAPAPDQGAAPFDASQVASGPSDAYLASQSAPPAPQVDAVSGAGGYDLAVPQPGTGGTNFQPKTYDFGNQDAKQMEYDNMGNLYELLPKGGGSLKVGQKSSESGYSAQKMGEIEAGPMGSEKMKKGEAGRWQEAQDRFAPLVGRMEQANVMQLQTEDQASTAEQAQVEAKAAGMGKISSLYAKHEQDLMHLNESTLLAKQKAQNEYRQKLLEIPSVNPDKLWDDAGPGGRFQMSVAAFVHDMLGVKGIKTSAMDTINGAIKNNIDAQIANINTKKQVASGFKDLYDQTVAESATQMEVKAKLQGYMLKSMEAGIDASMGKIDSNVARAKHAQAKSVLRQAQVKNLGEVFKHQEDAFDKAAQRDIAVRGQNITAAIAKAGRENDLTIAEIRARAAAGADLPPVIYDQTKSGGGKAIRRIKKEYAKDAETVRNVSDKVIHTATAVESLKELNDIQAKIDGKGTAPAVLGKLRAERDRLEEAARASVVWALTVDVAGKRATDKDYERVALMVPEKGWFTNGNNRRIISQLVNAKLKETNKTLGQYTDDILQGDPAYGTSVGKTVFGEQEGLEATAIVEGQNADAIDKLSKAARSPDAWSPLDKDRNVSESVEYKQFTVPYWENFRTTRPDIDFKTMGDTLGRGKSVPPKAFHYVREIAEEAFNGNDKARQDLETMAGPTNTQDAGKNAVELKAVAKYFLERMDSKAPVPGAEGTRGFGIETDNDKPVDPDAASEDTRSSLKLPAQYISGN